MSRRRYRASGSHRDPLRALRLLGAAVAALAATVVLIVLGADDDDEDDDDRDEDDGLRAPSLVVPVPPDPLDTLTVDRRTRTGSVPRTGPAPDRATLVRDRRPTTQEHR